MMDYLWIFHQYYFEYVHKLHLAPWLLRRSCVSLTPFLYSVCPGVRKSPVWAGLQFPWGSHRLSVARLLPAHWYYVSIYTEYMWYIGSSFWKLCHCNLMSKTNACYKKLCLNLVSVHFFFCKKWCFKHSGLIPDAIWHYQAFFLEIFLNVLKVTEWVIPPGDIYVTLTHLHNDKISSQIGVIFNITRTN